MKTNIFLYLLIMGIVFVSYLITGTYYLFVISVLLFLIGIFSGICMLININKIQIEIMEGNGKWMIQYKSPYYLPLGQIHVNALVYNCFFDEMVKIEECFLIGNKQIQISLPFLPKLGCYVMKESSIVLFDMFKLFKKYIRTLMMKQLYVYPSLDYPENATSIAYQLEQRNNEKMDEYDLREYRKGDSLKDIHHKISFKMNTLIVKEKLKQNEDNIHVLLDLSGDEMACLQVFSYFHCFIESLQFYGEECIVFWYSKDVLHKEKIKTLTDKEVLVSKILSMPKATFSPSSSTMWTICATGLEKGEDYE